MGRFERNAAAIALMAAALVSCRDDSVLTQAQREVQPGPRRVQVQTGVQERRRSLDDQFTDIATQHPGFGGAYLGADGVAHVYMVVEQRDAAGMLDAATTRLGTLADGVIVIAYVISVALYLRTMEQYLIGFVDSAGSRLWEPVILGSCVAVIVGMGAVPGLAGVVQPAPLPPAWAPPRAPPGARHTPSPPRPGTIPSSTMASTGGSVAQKTASSPVATVST